MHGRVLSSSVTVYDILQPVLAVQHRLDSVYAGSWGEQRKWEACLRETVGKEASGGLGGRLAWWLETGESWASCPDGRERSGQVGDGEELGTRLAARLQSPAGGRTGGRTEASSLSSRRPEGRRRGVQGLIS